MRGERENQRGNKCDGKRMIERGRECEMARE